MSQVRGFLLGFGSAALLLAWGVQDTASKAVPPAPVQHTSAWGDKGASSEFASNLRMRLDDLAGMQGTTLILGWSMLMKDFGLIYDGHMLGDKDDWAPCRFGWHVDCSAIGAPTWILENASITQEDSDRGRIENEVLEIPKQAQLRFITASGVSETMPTADDLAQSVLFISFGAKAMLVDMRNGNYYRLPFDRPSAQVLDRSPGDGLLLSKWGLAALEPSPFWD